MDQELKIGNLPQRQLGENQAKQFLSKRVELPAGALIPEYYWPAHVREEFEAQKREKEALIKKVYKPAPSLEESIRTYQNRLDDQQRAIERYEALYERYQQGLLSEREVEQMKIWRSSILAKMGTGRSYDPWMERFYNRASEAYDRGEASGDFNEFFDVVAEYLAKPWKIRFAIIGGYCSPLHLRILKLQHWNSSILLKPIREVLKLLMWVMVRVSLALICTNL